MIPHLQSTRPVLLGPSKADNAGNVIKVSSVYHNSKDMGMMAFPAISHSMFSHPHSARTRNSKEVLTLCPLPTILLTLSSLHCNNLRSPHR